MSYQLGLGFSGSHRSGKTTAATQLSLGYRHHGVPDANKPVYVDMGTTSIVRALDITVNEPMSPHDRMRLQDALFDHYITILGKQTVPFVTDRTFLDLVAYPMMDVTIGHPGFPNGWLRIFSERCAHFQRHFFHHTVILDTYYPVPDEDKAVGYLNEDYANVYTKLIKGIAAEWRM